MFKNEINYILDQDIKNIVKDMLGVVPEYFFHIPASSTGKYHPSYSLGEAGLVRHTKSAVRIAVELFNNDGLWNFTDYEKDIIVAALILHDTYKCGNPKKSFTVTEHPLLASASLELLKDKYDDKKIEDIKSCISSHMGKWCYNYKTGEQVLPKPSTEIERFAHLCDYLSSRKCLEFNFEAEIKRV